MKPVFVFLFPALLFACNDAPDKKSGGDTTAIVRDSVPAQTAVQPLDTAASSMKTDSVPAESVIAVVYYNLSYCGGAAPSEEILKEKKKYHLLTSSSLLLKNKTVSKEVKTDANGTFTTDLPSGQYDVYLTSGVNPKIHSVKENDCENCLTKPIAKADLDTRKVGTIYFTFPCAPGDKMRP